MFSVYKGRATNSKTAGKDVVSALIEGSLKNTLLRLSFFFSLSPSTPFAFPHRLMLGAAHLEGKGRRTLLVFSFVIFSCP